jgi:nitrite reductase/ring-hydroxylating ferredoxin subunit
MEREATGPVHAGSVEDLQARGCLTVQGGRHGIAVFWDGERPQAVDNRCPHLGFPLAKGTLRDGILTCHWHHWRFDVETGGCFNGGGEDVRVYRAWTEDGQVWVDTQAAVGREAAARAAREDLRWSLEHQSTLRAAKSLLKLRRLGGSKSETLRESALFGATYREDWSAGMSILTALGNVLEDEALPSELEHLALVHGVRQVAQACAERPPRHARRALPAPDGERLPEARLEGWLRMFVEEREEAGAERCLLTALAAGWDSRRVAGMLYSAATDHFFLDEGHVIDFVTKALELLDHVGWAEAPRLLPLLVPPLCRAKRYEEDTEWRYPYDFVPRLAASFEALPRRTEQGRGRTWGGESGLVRALQADEPGVAVDALDEALEQGASALELGRALALAAAYRLARYNLRNEVFDWETMHHAFTTANAVYQAAKRAPAEAVLRGIYHGAVKLYLVRFLTLPPARLPHEMQRSASGTPAELLEQMEEAMGLKRPTEAALALDAYWRSGADRKLLLERLAAAVLREDAGFHEVQSLEAALRIARDLEGDEALVPLIGAVRYLAAHFPTDRFVSATVDKAVRLERGEDLAAED